jgi:hypothetical protein
MLRVDRGAGVWPTPSHPSHRVTGGDGHAGSRFRNNGYLRLEPPVDLSGREAGQQAIRESIHDGDNGHILQCTFTHTSGSLLRSNRVPQPEAIGLEHVWLRRGQGLHRRTDWARPNFAQGVRPRGT